jgi:C-terminal processing protease CtpA/Prc
MKRLCLAAITLLLTHPAVGQELLSGITLGGGTSPACPLIITEVWPGSPVESAGIKAGDLLLEVGGSSVATTEKASEILHSKPEPRVVFRLVRGDTIYTATVERGKFSNALEKAGLKELSMGMIAPVDATETEMQDKMKVISQDRFADRVFPSHYPTNENLYYAGFEVLILKNPSQVVVLGIEDGPASRAGVHWGDTILSVNGVDPRNKSVPELERLFSSKKPSLMSLKIERGSVTTVYAFELAKVAKILRDNGKQIYRGDTLPLGIPEKYLRCFRP